MAESFHQRLVQQETMAQFDLWRLDLPVTMIGQWLIDQRDLTLLGDPRPKFMIVQPGRAKVLVKPSYLFDD